MDDKFSETRPDLRKALQEVLGGVNGVELKPLKKKLNKKILNLPSKDLPIKPLTLEEMHAATKQRLSLITKEFKAGFDFIEKYPKSVTFFGSARLKEDDKYYKIARSVAHRIATELNYAVITGGGPGIMEAANRGAFEGEGPSVGITIELPNEQVTNSYLTDHVDLYYFFSRKVAMTFSAEAYVYFPGGFGTIDEFMEIMTLIQTNKIEKVPIILYGGEFWKPLEQFFTDQLLSRGLIDREDLNLFVISDNENQVIDIISSARVRNGVRFNRKQKS